MAEYMYADAVIRDDYEISIWDDVWDQNLGRYKEEKVAIIGSNKMTAPHRAIDPVVTQNTNGTQTLTFSIFYRYIDPFDGREKINPFIKLLINERKIKLKWKNKSHGDHNPDDWYDFIIKNKVESSDGKSYQYTCDSLAANELTKTGFHLEFDTELSNNTDTAWNLAGTVLEGTDWRITDKDGKNFRETVTDSGYKVAKGSGYVLLFYNTVTKAINRNGNIMIQYWAPLPENPVVDTKGIIKEGSCVTIENGSYSKSDNIITFYNGSVSDNSRTELFTLDLSDSGLYEYRAKRDVPQQLTVFSPPLDRYVGRYTYTDPSDSSISYEVLGYTTAEYVSPEVVTNLIVNSEDCHNTDGWFNAKGFTVYPYTYANTQVNDFHPKGYLIAEPGTLGNNCFLKNGIYIPDGLIVNDTLVCHLDIKKAVYNPTTATYSISNFVKNHIGRVYISDYIIETTEQGTEVYKPDPSGIIYASVEFDNEHHSYSPDLTCELQITTTLTYADLYTKRVALFIDFDECVNNSTYLYAIEKAELYFKRFDVNENQLTPNSVDSTSVITYTSKYFLPADNDPLKTEQDINWLYIGISNISEEESKWQAATPKYDETCEKIRTISGKNSTRFNWLQTIAETFELWCKFWVEHDENGNIIWETEDGVPYPRKWVTFQERIGENADYGFIYGIDLKSIQRTNDSSQIATKIIVPQNSNEFGENGFCTIQRSSENYSGENYILNFDYYMDNGLVDRGQLYADLYYTRLVENGNVLRIGYYQELHRLNTEYDVRADQIESIKNDLDRQNGYLTVYQGLEDSTILQINDLQTQIMRLIAEDLLGEPRPYDPTIVQQFMDTHADPPYQELIDRYNVMTMLEENLAQYRAIIYGIPNPEHPDQRIGGLIASIAALNKQLYGDDTVTPAVVGLYTLQDQNREERQSIIDEFNKRYSRYVQEGTWSSEDYVDDTKYYLDATSVAYEAARPKLSYNISVIRVSALEPFKNKIFKLGDITWVEDEDFFMSKYHEEVVITQLVSHLEAPENDTITVQNYRTQFQDLFQRTEATIQSFQYGEGSYNRVAAIMESDGTIDVATLQNSIAANNALMSQSGLNNAITTGPEGITVTDITNPSNQVRITANGVFISTDGGNNWINAIKGDGISTDALSAGIISVKDIVIDGGQGNTFRWDSRGISAYWYGTERSDWYDSNGNLLNTEDLPIFINTSHFVRFDKYGIYGIAEAPSANWAAQSEDEVFQTADFGMTWNRFFMKNRYGDHYVEISSTNDIRVMGNGPTEDPDDDIELIKIGQLDDTLGSEIYGIRISDSDRNTILETNNIGQLWLRGVLNVETSEGNYVSIGALINTNDEDESGTIEKRRVIDANNNFIVWEDGSAQVRSSLTIQDGNFSIIYGDTPILQTSYDAETGTIKASFNGTIKAFDGTIGGFNIGANEIQTQDGNLILSSNDADGESSIIVQKGNIGGFTIKEHEISSNGLYLQSEYSYIEDEETITVPSQIIVDNIELGVGAKIENYIQLGLDDSTHAAYIYNPSAHDGRFIQGGQLTFDENNQVETGLIINNDGTAHFGKIGVDGINSIISGVNWSISPTLAEFNNINVIGKITSAVFETGHISTVGGAMLFRPATKIEDISISGTTAVITINRDDAKYFNVGDYIKFDQSSILKINSKNDNVLTIENIASTEIGNITLGSSIINLGNGNDDKTSIGVNSMPSRLSLLTGQALSIVEVYEDSETNTIVYPTRLVLGNLANVQKDNVTLSGYGLYADNVFLNGSLTTEYNDNSYIKYAGINTISTVEFILDPKRNNYIDWSNSISYPLGAKVKHNNLYWICQIGQVGAGAEPGVETSGVWQLSTEIDNSPIIFWAGSIGTDGKDIEQSKFQVTSNGTLYAQQALITGSVIANGELRTPKIIGTNTNDPALAICGNVSDGTNNGIWFYNTESTNAIPILKIDINSLSYKDIKFVEFNNDTVTLSGYGDFIQAEIGDLTLSENKITNSSVLLDATSVYFGSENVEIRKVDGGCDIYIRA